MIKNIFFDLDNTILDFHMAERRAVEKTLQSCGIAPTEEIIKRYSEINLAQWKLLERKELTLAEVKLRRWQIMLEILGCDEDAAKLAGIYEGHLSQGHYFMDGAEAMLEALYGRYHLYLASNGTSSVQRGRLASAGIEKYFDDIFISEEIGFFKPDAAYFSYCFSRIPCFQKEESLLVGDSLTSDIRGGNRAGIKTVWLDLCGETPLADAVPDFTIHRLAELSQVLTIL